MKRGYLQYRQGQGRLSGRVVKKRRVVRKKTFRKGYDRTGGYYGRFRRGSPEKKFHDVDVDDATISAAMTINNLTVIPEGNGESERIGRKITITNIYWRYALELNSKTAIADTSDIVKVMLVQDTQTNGAQFAATDLLETDEWKSFRNLANSKRFRVLYSESFAMQIQGATPTGAAYATGEDVKIVEGSRKCNITIEYDNSASTGAIATVKSNNLYWVTQSRKGVTPGHGNIRLRYTDL
jgi:hypothetical protein